MIQKQFNQNIVTVQLEDIGWWEEPEVYVRGSFYLPYFDREILYARIKRKLAKFLNIDPKQINENSRLIQDLNIDQTEIPTLIRIVEYEYDLKKTNRLAAHIKTVGHLLNYCRLTWRSDNLKVWFRDPEAPIPRKMTIIRRTLKFINQFKPINIITTFIRQFLGDNPSPIWVYIVQGRIRWLLLKEQEIDLADEILPEDEQRWEKWYEWPKEEMDAFLDRVSKFHPSETEEIEKIEETENFEEKK